MNRVTHLQARWIYRGHGAPVERGVLAIQDGKFVDPATHPPDVVCDVSDSVIIPGLINAHTHLEFSDLPIPVEPRREFATWISRVIRQRRSRTTDAAAVIRQGLNESLDCGVTALGEIATGEELLQQTFTSPVPESLFFKEYLGLRAEGVEGQLRAAREFVEATLAAGKSRFGLSPHAPYSLHPQLFHGLCDLAAEYQLPVTMHLAESPAELQLLAAGTGPLVDLFTSMDLWRSDVIPLGTRPLDYLKQLADLPRVLVAHGNLLTQEELEFVARHPQFSVIYCPRTHQAMQSTAHPWLQMRELGINVAVGTDSRASNPDLSIWKELQLLQQLQPDLPASEILELATAYGAQALGLPTHGLLSPGQTANLCVLKVSDATLVSPERHLFHADNTLSNESHRVMLHGRWTSL